MAKYPPAVERWRPLVEKYFPPELVDKALYVIQGESGGDPKAFGGGATGLFQIQALPGRPAAKTFEDPETNVRYAAQTLGAARNKWSDWGEGTEGQAPYDPKTGKGRFGALGNHPYQGGAVNGRAGTDTTFGGGSMPPAQTKPTGGILGAAGQGLAAGAHAVDPEISAASRRMDDIVAQMGINMPRKTDPEWQSDPIGFQTAFGKWAVAYKNYEAAQKSLALMTQGVVKVGDQLVPMEDAPPEVVAAAKVANLNTYHAALNQLGLDEFKTGRESRGDANSATTQDFQNKTAAFGNSRDFDTLNLSKSKQELDRWMQGQQTATSDQTAIRDAQTMIGKYGTTNGKTAFSGKDLGAGFAAFANAFGMGDAPLIQYPGTQTFNPVKDRLDSLAGMGIDNVAPHPGALHTTADMLPQPGQLDTSVQPAPQFLDPVDPTTGLPGGAGPAGTGHMLPPGVTAGAGDVDPSLLGYAHGTRHAPQHLDIVALLAHHKAQVMAQMHGGGQPQPAGGMIGQPLPASQPQMPPGMPGQGIPRFAGGTGPADVGTAVTGTQIPIDAANANATIMGPVLTQRGQDLTYQVALMNAQQAAQQAQRQYYVDLATIGQNAATLNFQQRQADVQQQMQYAQQLQLAQTGRVDARFKALDLMAAHSGPQDWPAYNYLLNQMGAPTGKLVDPTKFADEIKDPEKPAGLGSINQQYTPDTSKMTAPSGTLTVPDKPAPINMNGGGGGSGAPNQPPQQPPAQKPAGPAIGSPTAAGQKLPPGQSLTNGVVTNDQGQPWNEQYQGWDDKQGHYYKNGGWTNPDGSPYQAMVSGGATHAGQFITGDKPGSLGDDSEMIVNPTNAPIQVLPHDDLIALLQRHKAAVMPHFAGGTGWDNALGSTAGMDAGWGTPSIKAGPMYPPGGGGGPMTGFTGDMGKGSPMYPPSGAGGAGLSDSGWTGSEGGYASQPKQQPVQQQPLNPAAWQQGPQGGVGATQPGWEGTGTDGGNGGSFTPHWSIEDPKYINPTTGAGGNPSQPPLTTQPINAQPIGGAPGAPAGGSTVLNPDGSYGMPTTPGYRVYDPKVLGSQPFYQKLLGNMGHPDFQGFGAPLSNASLGIQNAPWAMNLQNYLGLNASEKDQTQGLYNQGLGVDFRDILAQAKAAYAPMLQGRASRYLNPAYGA